MPTRNRKQNPALSPLSALEPHATPSCIQNRSHILPHVGFLQKRAIDTMVPKAPREDAPILRVMRALRGKGRRLKMVPRGVRTEARTMRLRRGGWTMTEMARARVQLR